MNLDRVAHDLKWNICTLWSWFLLRMTPNSFLFVWILHPDAQKKINSQTLQSDDCKYSDALVCSSLPLLQNQRLQLKLKQPEAGVRKLETSTVMNNRLLFRVCYLFMQKENVEIGGSSVSVYTPLATLYRRCYAAAIHKPLRKKNDVRLQ